MYKRQVLLGGRTGRDGIGGATGSSKAHKLDRLEPVSYTHLDVYKRQLEQINEVIGADTLGYLSNEHVVQIAKNAKCGFCTACFTGEYAVEPESVLCTDIHDRHPVSYTHLLRATKWARACAMTPSWTTARK